MTLAPYLVDTCQRYKKGTRQFLQWLSSTASDVAPTEHLFYDELNDRNSDVTSGRLKGKARTQAKQPVRQVTYVLLASFRPLAHSITAAQLAIPSYIMAIMRDVIDSRKECAVFYKAQ
jgi:hypothetical protein